MFQMVSQSVNSVCITVPNFATIGQTVEMLWPFLDVSRWRPSSILDLLYAYLGSLMKSSWYRSVYRFAKFGWNRPCNYGNLRVSLLCEFGLKMPIHAQKHSRY